MTILDRLKLATQLSLENYDKFLDLKDWLEQGQIKISFLYEAFKPVFAADAVSALSDDDLCEQLESHFGVSSEGFAADVSSGRVREVIQWMIENKDLILTLIALFAKKQ
jgi:hypothetical protein